MSVAIKVENLSKIYRLGEIGTGTISRDMERWFRTRVLKQEDPFLRIGETNDRASRGESDIVYSLRDINFEINQGDAVGIIGRNGAGKSTLLKILSRVTTPTTGRINIKGRVASLLEVGTGFHPELTGRENIYLNGAILGMRKREIDRKLDEIIDFSGVERYIDTPVKRYSSGMYVRLAFAVAAHLQSEILIVDEVLAVGDAEFQKKCLGKMGEVSKGEGRTVLFVSHNMGAISELCQNCILMNNGIKFSQGESQKVLSSYKKLGKEKKTNKIKFDGELGKDIEVISMLINGEDIFKNEILVHPNQNLEFKLLLKVNLPKIKIRVSIVIFYNDIRICTISDHRGFHEFNTQEFFSFKIKRNILRPGLFTVGVGVRTIENRWAWQKSVSNFEILDISIDEFYKYDIGIINIKSENT